MTAAGSPNSSLADAVRAGDRRALARAITLVESTRPDDRARAAALVADLLPAAGGSLRIGITGVPGVGKSTFIEAFGALALRGGRRLAVLAVDPSSRRTGGSILGDKTRMERLAVQADVFVRPSPTGGTLGGVALRTREALLLCEAAGFDVVFVETAGVGQSETAVADMVDLFLLLLLPGGGDELQGLKRGIVELADLIVVNKADGDLRAAADRAAADYAAALNLLRGAGDAASAVLTASARTGAGLEDVWTAVTRLRERAEASGATAERRAGQARAWLRSEIDAGLRDAFRRHRGVAARLPALEERVVAGRMTPGAAAAELVGLLDGSG